MTEISLRGSTWAGVSYESELYPTSGTFTKMNGCYISKDGTEIVPFPGFRLIAKPPFAQHYYVGFYNSKVYSHATTNANDGYQGPHNFVSLATPTATGADSKLLVNNTVTDSAFVLKYTGQDATHGCDLPGDTWYELSQSDSANGVYGALAQSWNADTDGVNGGTGADERFISALNKNIDEIKVCRLPRSAYDPNGGGLLLGLFGFRECIGRLGIFSKSRIHYSTTAAAPPVQSYGLAEISSQAGCISNTEVSLSSILDYRDFIYVPCVPEAFIREDKLYADNTLNFYTTTGDIYSVLAPSYRPSVEAVDGRIVLAEPGMGMLFQMDLKDNYNYYGSEAVLGAALPIERSGDKGSWKLDALGIPKAAIVGEAVLASGALISGFYGAGETVFFCACYYSSKTGKFGIRSEIQEVTVVGNTDRVDVEVANPRLMMRETDADTVILFATKPGDSNPASLYVCDIKRASPMCNNATPWVETVSTSFTIPANTTLVEFSYFEDHNDIIIPPVIPGMAMGAIAVKAAAGKLFCAGATSSSAFSDKSVNTVLVNDGYDTTKKYGYVAIRNPFLMSGKGIPSAYQGIEAYAPAHATSPNPINKQRLPYLYNIPKDPGRAHETRWKIPRSSDTTTYPTVASAEMPISLPKGHVWFSEKGEHDEFAAVNRIIADRLAGVDVIAIGRHDTGIIVCSQNETYYFSLQQKPYDQDAILISDSYGCIAPASMVECEDGVAWISDRGPVFFGMKSGFRWVGRGVEQRFNDEVLTSQGTHIANAFKRDSNGLMMNVRGSYDRSRKAVFWLMRSDTYNSGYADLQNDGDRSLAGADEIMIWSKESGAVTFHQGGGDMQWGDISPVTLDGYKTTCIMSNLPVRQKSKTYSGGSYVDTWSGSAVPGIQIPGRIYAMRDDTQDRMVNTAQLTAGYTPVVSITGGSAEVNGDYFIDSTETTDLRDDLDWYQDSSDTQIEAIQYNAFIRSGTTNEDGYYDIRWYGRVDRIYTSALPTYGGRGVRIVSGDPGNIQPGDVMEIGCSIVELETNLTSMRNDIARMGKVKGVIFRHSVVSQSTFESSSSDAAWVSISVYGDDGWYPLHENSPYGLPMRVGHTTTRITGGAVRGHDTAVRITIVGNGKPKIKDIRLEVVPGG